jgi:cytochrome c oxidase subunit 3
MAEVALGRTEGERYPINSTGLWLFIFSEAFLFLVFISTRFALVGTYRPSELNQGLGGIITLILLSSSFTAYRGLSGLRSGSLERFRRLLLATVALGLIFLVGVALEWTEGFEFFPPSTTYGTAFFTLTGLHGLHVISGILVLGALYLYSRGKTSTHRLAWAAEGSIRYWTFVDFMWLLIYPTLYWL